MDTDNWKSDLLEKGTSLIKDNSHIYRGKITDTMALQFHMKMPKGAALRELTQEHLHLAYWETPYFYEVIERLLKEFDVDNSIIADIGCGDGRFTELLIRLGFKKIIATDVDMRSLESLEKHLIKTCNIDKVLLIHTEVENIPVKNEICDAVLCIDVLYYINDSYIKGLKELHRLLKKGADLINSEPDLEGAIYKSVFFETMDDVYENYFNRIFKEERGDTNYKFRLFSEQDMMDILSGNGFVVKDKHGLSLFPSIVRIMMVRGQIKKEDLAKYENRLREVMDYLNVNGKLHKHIIWHSKKNN